MISILKNRWGKIEEGNIVKDLITLAPIILNKERKDFKWEPMPLIEMVLLRKTDIKFVGHTQKGIAKFIVTSRFPFHSFDHVVLVLYGEFEILENTLYYNERMWIIDGFKRLFMKYVHEIQNFLKHEKGIEIGCGL